MNSQNHLTPTTHWRNLFAVVCLALGGCSAGPSLEGGNFTPTEEAAPPRQESVQVTSAAAATRVEQIFAANSAPSTSADSNDDYRIAPLDVVEISVFGVPELSRTVQVNSSGTINLPLIKEIHAGGRTMLELERDIAAELDKKYLQQPQVSVYVKEFNSQRITVDGAVKSPGIFPITGKTSLLQAVALSGGLNEVADPAGILVFRTLDGKRMGARFDLRQIRSGKQSDPMLQAGDIVMVDESSTRTTLRDVKDVMPLGGLFSFLLL
jgi:polysaccharide export outer membrane protein